MRDLIRHFFAQFFDTEAISPQGEAEVNITQILGFLATPGAFLILILQIRNFRGWDLAEIRCLFIWFSMVVAGFLVVFEWDALFPNRRDYQILTPLPVSLFRLFASKAVAFGLFVAMFLVDANFFSTLLWPAIDNSRSYLAAACAHLLCVMLGGLFAALSLAGVQGVLLALLPAAAFRRVSVWMQTTLMFTLVMLLFLSPVLAPMLQQLIRHHSPWLYAFPPYWFAGLYERLRPAIKSPELWRLGGVALWGLAGAAGLFLLTYLPGYRRLARKMLEAPQPSPKGPARWRRSISSFVDRRVLRDPVQSAVFHFMNQTITRSMKHRLFLATYAGCGGALAIAMFRVKSHGMVALPLTLSFILISALRAAFNFPSELGANWAFQASESRHARGSLRAMRKWIAICALGPLLLAQAAMEFRFFAWTTALFHLAFGAVVALLLIEIMFVGFRKVPFTCSYFPGKINLVFLAVIYVLGFTIYSGTMASLEEWLAGQSWYAAAFLVPALATAALLAYWRDRQAGAESLLEYQDAGDPVVRTLELSA
ncbi:MAG TPA: hypothetical protein VHW09_18905 [Bryobacteraceae bacterium]|jgi:hypothetical protein|nr:hypothetical protein [Bryobacteraceae bacterium]